MYNLGLHIYEFVFLFMYYSIYKRVCLKKRFKVYLSNDYLFCFANIESHQDTFHHDLTFL